MVTINALIFDGKAFASFYNLGENDYQAVPTEVDGIYELIVPSLPDLTQAEVDGFIIDQARIDRIAARRDSAEIDAKTIPDFATQDKAWFQAWFDANLSDAIIDGIADFAGLKVVLKKIVVVLIGLTKMVVAMRNKNWPSLPED